MTESQEEEVVGVGGPICVDSSLAPKRYVGSTMPVKPKLLGIKFRATLLGAMEDDGRRPSCLLAPK